jgi:hypothetical protein
MVIIDHKNESVIAVPAAERVQIERSPDIRLVCGDDQVYSFFGTSLLRSDSYVPDLNDVQRYTHGIITSKLHETTDEDGRKIKKPAVGWHLTRTSNVSGKLIPEDERPFDVHMLQNLIVIPTDAVDEVVEGVGAQPFDPNVDVQELLSVWPPPILPAEKLYRAVRSRVIGGVGYTACGTYRKVDGTLELVVVDEVGGYSFGMGSMEGMADDQQLARMGRLAVPLSSSV